MIKSKLSNIAIPSIVVATLLFVPVLFCFYYIGNQTIFNLFATDSMYYMGIANNYLKFGFATFDGETAINGYHPLWELMLIVMFKMFSIQHHYQIYAVFALSALLVYMAYITISYTFVKIVGVWPGIVATLTLFPGVYSIFFEPRRHFFNSPAMIGSLSPYGAINGMETSLSLALWAFFFLTLISRFRLLGQENGVRHDIKSLFPFATRICLAMIVLSRLDDCFLVVAIGIFILSQSGISFYKKINTLIHVLLPTALVLLTYILFNELTVGSALPVSGVSKLSVDITINLHNLFMVLSGQSGTLEWWYLASCFYTIIFLMLAGIICTIVGRRYKNITLGLSENYFMMSLLNIFGLFLTLKALFLFTFVPVVNQGYWYYFTMVFVCNVIVAIAIGSYVKNNKNIFNILFFCLAIILFRMPNDIYFIQSSNDHNSGFGSDFDFLYPYGPNYPTISHALWSNSDEIRKFLIERGQNAKLIDNLDGMYVYLLDMPGESITGLASSSKELERRKKIGLMKSLVSRGFSIVPGFGYKNPKIFPQIIKVVDVLHPPSSPIFFYRVELTTGIQ